MNCYSRLAPTIRWSRLQRHTQQSILNERYPVRQISSTQVHFDRHDCKVLVVGGGSGGCALAAKLSTRLGKGQVIVLEPAERHYYQPMFTLIGGGMKRLEHCHKPMADVLPKKAKWMREAACEFDPDSNTVKTSGGNTIKYDMLLIATGLQLNYEKIPGLEKALSVPDGNVCSIYSPLYVEHVFDCLRKISGGNAIFTFPHCPIKCAGAPQKIAYIAEHYFRKVGKRDDISITYNTALPVLFGVKHYADALWPIMKKRNITVNTCRNLIEVKHEQDIAVFEDVNKPGELYEEKYSMLHAVPPMSPPDELTRCKQLVNDDGYVDVDKFTLQHIKYKNVFAIGDSSSTPNSKTAAAAAAQSPVVFDNMMAVIEGKPLTGSYDGYASCPLVTGYHTCMLAEFDYSLTPLETFPVAQNKERYSMFIMKKDFMPLLYWKLMLPGYWNGPALMRNMLSVFKSKKQK
ncbi:sulfide:quinone oxidoreductase, mitochondrial [Drosophila sulfurigaster albostrigata]|uniref:sulfide:quinone oxidoreductase, mitochondrial n=1 Tax=Drosophila sulfurigaster albostrigata TaxID=89887 RepID=UPI002D21B3C1|nr:sulfide:quinone oxidoreductase, mitochondrial [Drosophila sulfurigaster albostrigata]XP_062135230.1 sulfide:quinone oxidoreductase, mitochondrial [Drosophila sulfurigaster albostrigata]